MPVHPTGRLRRHRTALPAGGVLRRPDGGPRLSRAPFGSIRGEFRADIERPAAGDALSLQEAFFCLDGGREHRTWTVDRLAPGRYEGRAPDLAGVATGRAVGRAANWR
jgi:hypothetical protein